MKLYKLTDENGRTHGDTLWGEGVTHETRGRISDPQPCSSDVIHAYADSALALLMNPVHASFLPPRLWEAEGEPCVSKPDKLGCYSLTTTRELEVPSWYQDVEKRKRVQVRFAVLAARAVLDIFESARPGDDRPRKAIEAAEAYLDGRAAKAAYAAANAAAYAAYAANAAYAAAYAAANAAYAKIDGLDLAALARQAVELESTMPEVKS